MFSLLGLALVLGLMLLLVLLAAIGLGPGDSGSLGPVPAPPRFEAAVGDSVPLGSPRVAQVAQSVVAPGTRVSIAGGSVASAGRPSEAEGQSPAPAVGPAEAIAVATPAPSQAQPPAPTAQPVAAPAPEAVPAPTLVTAPEPPTGGGQGRPVTAGGPSLESCEGDEYLITIALAPEADGEEEQSVEIVLTKFSEDGSVEELRLEGDLLDAQSLALQLSSEGNCVHLEAGTPTEDGVPSGETSPAVVSPEGTPSSVTDPDSGEPAAPDSP